jgi:hypothetical protein
VTLFRIISAEKASFPVSLICDVLDVNRSSFYAWETRPPSDRALSDAWLTEQDPRDLDREPQGLWARGASTPSCASAAASTSHESVSSD